MKCFLLVTGIFFNFLLFSQKVNITVRVTGIKDTTGLIQIGVFNEKGYPVKGKEFTGTEIKAGNDAASASFQNIPEGKYAIAVFHDANSDRKLNTNVLGIPVEGYGFSNNSQTIGIPDFKKASIDITTDKVVTIELRYL